MSKTKPGYTVIYHEVADTAKYKKALKALLRLIDGNEARKEKDKIKPGTMALEPK